jgi:hypothetical protein
MAIEYYKPMLDVGSPRVFNCNVITRRLLATDESAPTFFRSKVLNDLVLIKDTIPEDGMRTQRSAIGTKLYFPFNEGDIYEGGRTIFAHDKRLESALVDTFGSGAFAKETLDEDLRILALLDKLPSLDPFLLKEAFRNEGLKINEAYFDVSKEVWQEIELFILQRFEPLVKAAFPDAMSSDEMARTLIEKIWEARDLQALKPLIAAFRLPESEALEIFSAWKGINFYSFQYERAKPAFVELLTWLRDLQIPLGAAANERAELKALHELSKEQMRREWQKADAILREYQVSYDKMFKHKVGSTEFLAFLKGSNQKYWELGNSLGKCGHASYCWNVMSKRFAARKVPWESLREIIRLLAKIFAPDKKALATAAWN